MEVKMEFAKVLAAAEENCADTMTQSLKETLAVYLFNAFYLAGIDELNDEQLGTFVRGMRNMYYLGQSGK